MYYSYFAFLLVQMLLCLGRSTAAEHARQSARIPSFVNVKLLITHVVLDLLTGPVFEACSYYLCSPAKHDLHGALYQSLSYGCCDYIQLNPNESLPIFLNAPTRSVPMYL